MATSRTAWRTSSSSQLLDSTFLHDLLRGEPAAIEKLDELIEERTSIAVSVISVFEVGVGLRGEAARYRDPYREVLDDISILSLSPPGAVEAIRIQHELLGRGERIDAVDGLIAGQARSHDVAVLTRNVGEFERVDGLDVETY